MTIAAPAQRAHTASVNCYPFNTAGQGGTLATAQTIPDMTALLYRSFPFRQHLR